MQARMGVPTHIIPQKTPPHKAMREQSAGRGKKKRAVQGGSFDMPV